MQTQHKIIFGDSRQMSEISSESIHLIITSPPYWQLKDYGCPEQIGFDDTYEVYVNNLNLVWSECHRVLYPGCRLCINIGDQFARSVYYGRYKIIPIRTEIIRFCETIGFDYMGAVIWQKVTTCNTTGGATIMGSFPYPRNGILKLDYEFILIFKKQGSGPKVSQKIKELSKLTTEEWNQYFAGHWTFGGEKQNSHLAMFPEELPTRLIRMFSFVGDTILDPFLGSGTTCLAAIHQQRNSIGYEINKEYKDLIKKKLGIDQKTIFQYPEIEFRNGIAKKTDFRESIKKLPYLFKDPVHFDKKLDPKKLHFGSKIDLNHKQREEYFRVCKILSPNLLLLDNGLKIRLLGISEKKETREKAIAFLEEKTKGRQVFMKFDEQKHDKNDNLLCYLYLSNKTFLNAHLIKKGFVDIDTSMSYKYKAKFLKEWRPFVCQRSGS
jgi:site-specific DNA-methyltransferase (adenine-specific)